MLNFFVEHLGDFIIETFSVFLGFISAFLLEIYLDKRRDSETRKTVLCGIKNELSKIAEILDSLEDDQFGLSLYDKPFWESVVSTGQVDLLSDHPLYGQIISIYYKINTANNWESLNTQACLLNGRSNLLLIKNVVETRKTLSMAIKEITCQL